MKIRNLVGLCTIIFTTSFAGIPVLANEAHTHFYSTWSIVKEPTCTETGMREKRCEVCEEIVNEEIEALGHTYKDKVIKPTYFEQGYTERTCQVCNEKVIRNKTPKLTVGKINTLELTKRYENYLTIQYSKVSGATQYEVFLNGKWKATTTSTTYKITGLTPATKYKLSVRARVQDPETKEKAFGAFKELTIWTNPKQPTYSVYAGEEKFTVKWNKVSGATSYSVYYKPDKKGTYKKLKTVGANTTSYSVNANGGRTYSITVKATMKVGNETYHSTYGTKNITVKYKYHIYRTKKSAPTYNLSTAETKKRYGSTWSNAYYSGYYDYRYGKNWRVIYINNSKKMVYVKNLTNVNAKVSLPASSVSQYSGKVFGSGACGVASTVSLVNSEKGASWNKDSVTCWVNKKGYYISYPLTHYATNGMSDKGIIRTVKEYSKNKYSMKNIYNYNVSSTVKSQLDKGKRCLVNMHCSGRMNHIVCVVGYGYENGQMFFYYTDSAYSGYNLPLRKIKANTMQYLARTVDCTYDNSHYILVLN